MPLATIMTDWRNSISTTSSSSSGGKRQRQRSALILPAAAAAVAASALYLARRRARQGRSAKKTVRMSCACGKVEYTVDLMHPSPPVKVGNFVCHCTDCQRFDRVLLERRLRQQEQHGGGEGGIGAAKVKRFADPVTGGTHLVQVYRARVRLLRGGEFLRVCKLTRNSHLSRVYSSCCHCPVFNVFGEAFGTTVPVMTVFGASVVGAPAVGEGGERDAGGEEHPFGEEKEYMFVSEACGPVKVPSGKGRVHEKVSTGVIVGLVGNMVKGLLLGLGSPTPMAQVKNRSVEVWDDDDSDNVETSDATVQEGQ